MLLEHWDSRVVKGWAWIGRGGRLTERHPLDLGVGEGDAQVIEREHAMEGVDEELKLSSRSVCSLLAIRSLFWCIVFVPSRISKSQCARFVEVAVGEGGIQ